MSRISALGDLLGALFERSGRLSGSGIPDASRLVAQCRDILSSRGEASVVSMAGDILAGYAGLDDAGRRAFFDELAGAFNPDAAEVAEALEHYAAEDSAAALDALFSAVEPPRQELLRRLNTAPGGTGRLVRMRADLLPLLREEPQLRRIDNDFRHLLASWFNRGFLVMQPIDWQTPAALLEKIIAYEAVHQIDSWDELRRRVGPRDRRCFAFFHPAIPDEPLIFVEVALTRAVPGSVQAVLAPDRQTLAPEDATTAVFYSISNCQPGLAGVSFGAFLIKQVVADLAAELPGLETFVTLSPVPGFRRWLDDEAGRDPTGLAAEVLAPAALPDWIETADEMTATRLCRAAAAYLLEGKRGDGRPLDPVARFHLGNGAELAQVNWPGDISQRGLDRSLGVMVNYLYRLDRIEANHEAFAAEGKVAASRAVKAMLKG